jgi:hypothetical protein
MEAPYLASRERGASSESSAEGKGATGAGPYGRAPPTTKESGSGHESKEVVGGDLSMSSAEPTRCSITCRCVAPTELSHRHANAGERRGSPW